MAAVMKPRDPDVTYSQVGTRPNRPDGVDKVTGRARYGADVSAPGMLIGKVLRSPHAHARIRSIDASRAMSLEGVKAVVTRDDFPGLGELPEGGGEEVLVDVACNVMAREKALYEGHAVAAVAATSARIAKRALGLIAVDYEVLPHVTDVDAAMAPDAPVLHETMFTRGVEPAPSTPSNIAERTEIVLGDAAEGFARADVVVEREFRTEAAHQGYIGAPRLHGLDVRRRQRRDVGLHPGALFRARHVCADSRPPALTPSGQRLGDRRRFRRQDHRLHRAHGARALHEDRASRQNRDGPR